MELALELLAELLLLDLDRLHDFLLSLSLSTRLRSLSCIVLEVPAFTAVWVSSIFLD